jgi:predicted deacylase
MTDSSIIFPAPGHSERRLLAFDAPILSDYEWPYFTITGAHDGPTLCVIAGIHGAEYPPIDALIRFCRGLDPATLRGRVLGVPVVNLPAFRERTPFVCPRDGKNPNRVFPGKPDGTFTEVLAYHFFRTVILKGNYLVDLHCGDLVEDLMPFSLLHQSGKQEVDETAQDLAVTFGLPYVIVEPPAGGAVAGSTDIAASEAGIPALIAEAGGIGQLTPEAVALQMRGLRRVMQRLNMLEGDPEPLASAPTIMRGFAWVRAERGGFFRKAVRAGDTLKAGDSLGEMVDLWGEPVATIASPVAGVALFVTTSPAIADDGLLVGIGQPEEV